MINETLVNDIRKIKDNTPQILKEGYHDWLNYIRTVKREADDKELSEYRERLMVKGIVDRPVEEEKES